MKILVIAAHPDDEILGMGGTIKKYSKLGDQVKIVIMAAGIFARRSKNYSNSPKYSVNKSTLEKEKKQLKELRKDSKKAAKIVGAKDIEFLDFPDNEMDLISNLEVTKKIENIISDFNPSQVYTHSPYDINIDHRIVYNATITATRPTPSCKIEKVFSFEVPSSTEWNFPSNFSPNFFVDISKELDTKLRAMSAYKNELRSYPHPRSLEALEIISKRWGTLCGFKAAEAFYLVRELRKELR